MRLSFFYYKRRLQYIKEHKLESSESDEFAKLRKMIMRITAYLIGI